MKSRSRYHYDRKEVSTLAAVSFDGVQDRAKQAFKTETDINEIVRRFGLTGELPPPSSRTPVYGDFTQVTDFHEAMTQITAAQQGFARLPAQLRDEFRNDPGRFLEFIENPENWDKAAEMGLLRPDAVARMRSEREKAAEAASKPPAPADDGQAQS